MGAEVTVCGPASLIPRHIQSLGVNVTYNLNEALQWCDVINMLRIQLERQETTYFPSLREYSLQYQLNSEVLKGVAHELTIMHPGPINRGVEITSEVADGANSIILGQVENGVAIRMAVLYLLSQQIGKTPAN